MGSTEGASFILKIIVQNTFSYYHEQIRTSIALLISNGASYPGFYFLFIKGSQDCPNFISAEIDRCWDYPQMPRSDFSKKSMIV